jgi:hypothetical protein
MAMLPLLRNNAMKNQNLKTTIAILFIGMIAACKKPDTEKPILTLVGAEIVQIDLGEPYNDPKAIAVDNKDKDISSVIYTYGTVNTEVVGSYSLKYAVEDKAGNEADAVYRTVLVRANKLTGSYTVTETISYTGSSDSVHTYSCNVALLPSVYNKLIISNLGDLGSDVYDTITLGTSISSGLQFPVVGDSVIVSSGTYSTTAIKTLNYSISNKGNNRTCNFIRQ